MSELRETIKKALPKPILGMLRDGRDGWVRARQWPSAAFHPWRRDSIRHLGKMKGIHKGKRCFIIGNGPSLRDTDLSKLRNEYSIGMNRFYMAYPDLGFTSTYYLSVNDLVVEQCAQDIEALTLPRFVSWRARKWLKPQDNLYFLHTTYTGPKFSTNLTGRLWEGATVTYVALQMAYYLGFSQVILIGVDHNFVTQGKPNATVVSQGDDPNHFHPGYFGKGFRWQLPDLDTSEIGYRMAKEAYGMDGRSVIDATVSGKLRVFPHVDYNSLFK